MQPTSPEIIELYRLVATWGIGVIGLLTATIAALFNSRQNKLTVTVSKAVTVEAFNEKLKESEVQRQVLHRETGKKLDEIVASMADISKQAITIGRLEERVRMLEDRSAYIAKWKHETVDPYIPNEMKNLNRRIEHLEAQPSRRATDR